MVNNFVLVQVMQALEHLPGNLSQIMFWDFLMGLKNLCKGSTIHVVQHKRDSYICTVSNQHLSPHCTSFNKNSVTMAHMQAQKIFFQLLRISKLAMLLSFPIATIGANNKSLSLTNQIIIFPHLIIIILLDTDMHHGPEKAIMSIEISTVTSYQNFCFVKD